MKKGKNRLNFESKQRASFINKCFIYGALSIKHETKKYFKIENWEKQNPKKKKKNCCDQKIYFSLYKRKTSRVFQCRWHFFTGQTSIRYRQFMVRDGRMTRILYKKHTLFVQTWSLVLAQTKMFESRKVRSICLPQSADINFFFLFFLTTMQLFSRNAM